MNNDLMFSSASDEWETPQAFFDALNAEFHFDIDVAASDENKKCDIYLTEGMDALAQNWDAGMEGRGTVCWMNPPYSRGLQGRFIAKAAMERLNGVTTVALLPARTDTKAFHASIYDVANWRARDGVEIRLLKGRLKFGGCANSAPFPSMVVVFRPMCLKERAVTTALERLIVDANRLCDRQLGGTYEADCRQSIDAARQAIAKQSERL